MSDPSSPGGPSQDPGPDEAPTVSSHIDGAEAQPQDASGEGATPRRRRLAIVAASALLVAAGAFLGVAIGHYVWPSHVSTAAQRRPAGGYGQADPGGLPFGHPGGPESGGSSRGSGSAGSLPSSEATSIAAKVDPALVNINVKIGYQSSGEGAATGIVLTPSGLVLTNNHVIDGATSISATDVGNGKTYSATVVGYDRSHDIAVIQLNSASGLKTAHLGDSSKLTVGQEVVAVGNAGGSGGTPDAAGGSVTALDQHIVVSGAGSSGQLTGLIETDAAVLPGDSGGPLVNTAGQVIGLDTAASSGYSFRSSGGQGFAIPVDTALTIANQIQSHQASATVHIGATGFLGIELAAIGGQGGFGRGDSGGRSGSPSSGATVAGVLSGSPAAHAGLAAGDVIVSVDGHSVASPTTLRTFLSSHHPGDHVLIGWKDHSSGKHTATVRLATGPAA